MHGPAASAVSVFLFGFAGVFLLYAGGLWRKLAVRPTGNPPAIPVHAFRNAAMITGVAFAVLGAALIWAAVRSLP